MAAGISYDSREGRAIAGAISAVMTGVSYATSAEMAGELGPFPEYAANRDAMLRVMRNHRRAAHGETKGYEGLLTLPVPLDLAADRRQGARRCRAARLGRRAVARRRFRLPQCAGDRHRADRHDRPRHGLRHDRHRTRLRAGEVQEAGRRRLLQDHQPLRARSARDARLQPRPDRRHRRLCGRPRHAGRPHVGRHPRGASRNAASATRRSARSKRRWNPPSTSASSSTNGRWARASASTC